MDITSTILNSPNLSASNLIQTGMETVTLYALNTNYRKWSSDLQPPLNSNGVLSSQRISKALNLNVPGEEDLHLDK